MAGVVAGIDAASGLANLFNTVIACFDYVLVAKQAAPRLQSLLVKLDGAQLRLTRWGKAAGLTGSRIKDEESLKSSGSFQLDQEQEKQAIQTFHTVAAIFEECQKVCRPKDSSKNAKDRDVKENETRRFDPVGVNWNPMHRYLHEKMQDIVEGRRNKVSVTQRIKFATYEEKNLETLISKINDHIDELYKIYHSPASEEDALGKAELTELLQVVQLLGLASERDHLLKNAVQTLFEQKASGN